jgi:hypothetical protein
MLKSSESFSAPLEPLKNTGKTLNCSVPVLSVFRRCTRVQRFVFPGKIAICTLWLLAVAAGFRGLLHRNLHRFFCTGFATGSPLEVRVGG